MSVNVCIYSELAYIRNLKPDNWHLKLKCPAGCRKSCRTCPVKRWIGATNCRQLRIGRDILTCEV